MKKNRELHKSYSIIHIYKTLVPKVSMNFNNTLHNEDFLGGERQ